MAISDYIKKYYDIYSTGVKEGLENVGQKTLNFLKESGQASMRAYAGLGGLATGQKLTPSTYFQKELYGTDKPITLKSVGSEVTGEGKFKVLAAPVGFALGVGDVIPGGNEAKSTVITTLKNVDKVEDAATHLFSLLGVSKRVAQKYAPMVAKTVDEAEVAKIVDDVIAESQDVVAFAKRTGSGLASFFKKKPIAYKQALNTGIIKTNDSWGNEFFQIKGTMPEEVVQKGIGAHPRMPEVTKNFDDLIKDANTPATPVEVGRGTTFKDQKLVKFKVGDKDAFVDRRFLDVVLNKFPDADFIGGFNKERHVPIVATKNGEPVAVIMPVMNGAIDELTSVRLDRAANAVNDAISPELSSLAEEAKKYSSAEEFKKSIFNRLQDTFRGSDASSLKNKDYKFETRPTKDLAEWMAKTPGDQARIDRFKVAIQNGDPIPPIITTKNGGVIDGHNRLEAYRELNIENIPALVETGKGTGKVSNLDDFYNKVTKTTPEAGSVPKNLDPLTQEARKYKSAEEFVKAQTGGKFGTVKKIDINNPSEQPYISRFATDFDTKKSASGITYATADRMGSLNTALKQKGFKGVSNSDFKGIYSLDKVIDNPALFEKYPKLKELNVVFADFHTPTQKGVHIGDTVFLNSKLYAKDATSIESTLIHEVEHAIQDIEGKLPKFSQFEQGRGMNAKEYATDLREEGARGKQQEYLEFTKTKSQLTDIWEKATKAGPATRSEKALGVPGEVRKTPSLPQDIKLGKQKEAVRTTDKLPKQDISLSAKSDGPLETTYTKPQIKAIEKTAQQTGDEPKVVSRVIESLKKFKTNFIEKVQNEAERVRQLVERKDVKISDESNPYQKMTLYSGRVSAKIENAKKEIGQIFKDIKKAGINRKEISDYLYFRHAPERNLALGEKASGITTQAAEEGLKMLNAKKGVKEFADKIQNIHNQTLEMLRDSGVISDELFSGLREKYKNHVPLERVFEETEDMGAALSGKGFSVRSTGIKQAKGSEREVDDILTNIVSNHEQAVLRSEKNIVDQATLAFVRENKEALGDLFEIYKPKAIGKTFDDKIMLEKTTDPTVIQLFENGKKVWIKVKNPELATALQGVGRTKLPALLNAVGAFTRMYSGLATRFNPEFALPNKIRDLQETMVYLASQKDVGFKGAIQTAAKDTGSIKDVIAALRGSDTEGARLYNEMKSLGGTTGGFGLSTKKNVEVSLDKLETLANSKTRNIADNLMRYVDNWNTVFEDSTRLSVYKNAIKSGLSKDKAAFLAKEASINFNRMGTGGPIINAIWMFSNASIQGSTKMIRALKNPKVAGAVTVAVGGAVAAVNEWNNKVDPNWRDSVTKWDRLNGLPVMLPSEDGKARYFTIPVSWGIKPIKVMADYAYDAVDGKGFSAKNAIKDSVVSILEAYNPVGGTDLLSALSPTALDVPFEIGRNKAWSGSKIRPDSDPNAPADIQYFQSLKETKTGQAAISISELLQSKAGIAVSPADIKYAFEQYVGGAGRTVSKFSNLVSAAVSEDSLPLDEYPMLSRFYKERTAEEVGGAKGSSVDELKKKLEVQSRERFKIKNEAEELDKELSKMSSKQANEKAKQIKKENPKLYEKLKETAKDRKLGLNYEERLMKQLGVDNGERAKFIHQKIKSLKTAKEKNAYYKELRQKKIISDKVKKQLIKLNNEK